MQMASFWCLYCEFWTYFTPCSGVSIVNFEYIIVGWLSADSFMSTWNYLLGTLMQKHLRARGNPIFSLALPSCHQNKLWFPKQPLELLFKGDNMETMVKEAFSGYWWQQTYLWYCPTSMMLLFTQLVTGF